MHDTIELNFNPYPSDGNADTLQVLDAWKQLQLLTAPNASPPIILSRGADSAFQISIDASDVVDCLEREASDDEDAIEARLESQLAEGLHPMRGSLLIDVVEVSGRGDMRMPMQLLGRFLQQIFLAMNLSVPGSANFYASRYTEQADNDYPPPDLSSSILEGAYAKACERGWPCFRPVTVRQSWNWLQEAMSYDLDVARAPVDRALFAVLHVCEPQEVDAENILRVAQAFEALFAGGRESIGSVLHQRMEAVLGAPMSHKRWFNKFYDLRSRIAHGDVPVLRPGKYYDIGESSQIEQYIAEFWEPMDQAVAALLAVLQDLVIHNSRSYRFEQQVLRDPL